MQTRSITVAEIAKILKKYYYGQDKLINGLTKLVEFPSEYTSLITYCLDSIYLDRIVKENKIEAIITTEKVYSENRKKLKGKGVIISQKPKKDFIRLHEFLVKKTIFYNEYNFISKIGHNCSIHESACIEEGVRIGKNVVIKQNVVIHKGSIIGNNCVINANTTIGGIGYEVDIVGSTLRKLSHTGGVAIGNNVEIGSNCCVDKALTDGYTKIKDNTKIDNQVQIAHNAIIGKNVFLCANVQISGSVVIEDDCYLAPSANVRNQVRIIKGSLVGMSAVVTKDILVKGTYIGVPAKLIEEYITGKTR